MEEAIVLNKLGEDLIDLPPGFRFHPTDEEIITYYLTEKVMNGSFSATAIGQADLNKCEPWDLPKKAKMGEKEWYFFCQRDRKYPTGMRTNRATESGYWKATGKDKEIYKGKGCLVGMKKTLVFYKGRAPKGEKTNWVMHEYRLEGKFSYYNLPKSAKDEWVVCRVFHKNMGMKKTPIIHHHHQGGLGLLRIDSHSLGVGDDDHVLDAASSLPPLMDSSSNYSNTGNRSDFVYGHDQQLKGSITASTVPSSIATTTSSSEGTYLNYLSNNDVNDQKRLHDHHVQQQNHKYLYQIKNLQQLQLPNYNYQAASNPAAILYSHLIPNSNQLGHFQQAAGKGTVDTCFDDQEAMDILTSSARSANKNEKAIRQCKVEQFSSSNNHSMVSLSQDTGLSTDINTTAEISSANVSNQQVLGASGDTSYHHHQHLIDRHQGPSIGPISDMEVFDWDDF
ncbi:hypothetical protein FNV43_RR15122 [Rhamnella rubrinervis]|uniref:NAC domain-containing protein n=1 Tax=Rhamnella rubrinervis TaxID=2594499 RepID=A0A8K0E842_9ROSA|nr:hypothetical protein FNV43_RR15122 [Rhamnella rubrinervis]